MKIYKYRIPPEGEVIKYAAVRCGQMMDVVEVNGEIYAYMMVDDRCREKDIYFIAVGTGWDIGNMMDGWCYLGTVKQDIYVWHIYFRTDWDKDKGNES